MEKTEESKKSKREKVKKCLDTGEALPSSFRKDKDLMRDLFFNDTIPEETTFDMEYSKSGVLEPKILLTTSRSPSTKLQRFVKELKILFPNSQKINRGNIVKIEIIEEAKKKGVTDVVFVNESNGAPSQLIITHLPIGPTVYFTLSNIKYKDEINKGTMSEVYPNLVFEGFDTKLGNRTTEILKNLFPISKKDSKRIIGFINKNEIICVRNYKYNKENKIINVNEEGPRFDMKLYSIELGSIEVDNRKSEWNLKPFMNTLGNSNLLKK
eukprot:GHVP01058188.1.p1 GENE.GHVP01058188.1~~GHVP01058188.1.p1  ORF type:complete len:299 (-),score=67.85 GHVP01058188.1:128-931(-)